MKLPDASLPAISLLVSMCVATFGFSQDDSEQLDTASLVSDANLVFQEDFSKAASVDRFIFASPDHWKRVRVGDRYALEHRNAGDAYRPPHRSPHNIALIKALQLDSFVMEYEVQQIGREYGHRDACVFFNFVDPAHYYYIHVATKSDPHAHQVFTVNDAPRAKITQQGTEGYDWGGNDTWHRVRLVRDANAGTIQIYVDDFEQPILQASDNTHRWGAVGFGSFDDDGRVTNIRIYAKESREGNVHF